MVQAARRRLLVRARLRDDELAGAFLPEAAWRLVDLREPPEARDPLRSDDDLCRLEPVAREDRVLEPRLACDDPVRDEAADSPRTSDLRVGRGSRERLPRAPRELPDLPDFLRRPPPLAALSRRTSLLKLLCSPEEVWFWTIRARLLSSNLSNHSSQEISSSESSPV